MFDLLRKTDTKTPINPRFRAYGKARIDIARRAVTRADWDQLWKKPTNPFPFSWGSSWKQCIEYKVTDFPAEVGFFIDILGFPVNAFDPDYAMFTSPGSDFFFSVVPAREGEQPTQDGAIRLQFMVENIIETARELERRGVKFDQLPAPVADNSAFMIGSFRTPNGIDIELWGFDSRYLRTGSGKMQKAWDDAMTSSNQEPPRSANINRISDNDQEIFEDDGSSSDDPDHQGTSSRDRDAEDEPEYLPGEDY
jgi:catechol 2,3-dioxygenase-like lactoylglutathione lyase family enzyme